MHFTCHKWWEQRKWDGAASDLHDAKVDEARKKTARENMRKMNAARKLRGKGGRRTNKGKREKKVPGAGSKVREKEEEEKREAPPQELL